MATLTTAPQALSGRVGNAPSNLLHEEVLEPQFNHELQHLLPWYLLIEKVLLVEYRRMGLLSEEETNLIARLLGEVSAQRLTADPHINMSDIAFAIERYVEQGLLRPAVCWHVDRSRNDLQACAQLMSCRDQLLGGAETLLKFTRCALELAEQTRELPMPGYTHLQSAQIISPGFYMAAVSHQALHSAQRLLSTYNAMNLSPLGAGAMAGQELPWNLDLMARLLGCDGAAPHALTCVASRVWALDCLAEMSTLGVQLSRFATDLMAWGSSEYGFIDLPDALCGISSAMPQKKNFPVLERIRGRSAHLSAFYLDLVLGQRNTPYSNMVEVSKEAGAHMATAFATLRSTLRLFTVVLENLSFRAERMRASCERDYLGGFTLASELSLRADVPWRTAQIISGEYIVARMADSRLPAEVAPDVLTEIAERHGYRVDEPRPMLLAAFDVDEGLRRKRTPGSAHPLAVAELLQAQRAQLDLLTGQWQDRRERITAAAAQTDAMLGLGATPGLG